MKNDPVIKDARAEYREIYENAVRELATLPIVHRSSPPVNLVGSNDPIDIEANRQKWERHKRQLDAKVKALGLIEPNFAEDTTILVRGRVITDHGPEHGVLVEFGRGRAWIRYEDTSKE